jgi:uncharacterized protein (DUF2249 family)
MLSSTEMRVLALVTNHYPLMLTPKYNANYAGVYTAEIEKKGFIQQMLRRKNSTRFSLD